MFIINSDNVLITLFKKEQHGMWNVRKFRILFVLPLLLFIVSPCAASSAGDPYTWPAYNPTLNYNFNAQTGGIIMPTKDLNDCPGVSVTRQDSGWWSFEKGPAANSLVTSSAIGPLLARMNKDFAYFRDTMGWPPDSRAQSGYRSVICLYGSGLCTDNAANTATGGWESSIAGYPCVLLSYYPVYCFDPACNYNDKVDQQGACVHEGIHAILASLPGAKDAAWFQEGGNTWLQQQASAQQTKNYTGMGFLNGASFLAPFMPIECYSGWLQDGSFGGPAAEGVNKYSGSQQICTWRNFLGGIQYSNIFPTFLGEWLGLGSVPWIWKCCTSRVLQGMADTLGDVQIRRLIKEYRAKQAVLDMKEWTSACKSVLDGYFNTTIIDEGVADNMPNWIDTCPTWKATCYAKTTNDGSGLLTPEQRTTPGWSGANQIPLKITTGNAMVSVSFQPIGKNMSCQLCYRDINGYAVYSTPVDSGDCTLRLDAAPSSNVIIAVICNTDYKYLGEVTRTAHYDYRIKLGTGIQGTADIYTKWYNVTMKTSATEKNTAVSTHYNGELVVSFENRHAIDVGYGLSCPSGVSIGIYTASGALVKIFTANNKQPGRYTEKFNDAGNGFAAGTYVIQLKTNAGTFVKKATVVR
jgi:hypothetical protein